jgi:hypothetical protein
MNIAIPRLLGLAPSLLVAIACLPTQPAVAQSELAQPTCQTKAQSKLANAAMSETIVGLVESVQGSVLMVKLDNQRLRRVEVPEAQAENLAFLLGQRVVIQQQVCYRTPTPPIPQGW